MRIRNSLFIVAAFLLGGASQLSHAQLTAHPIQLNGLEDHQRNPDDGFQSGGGRDLQHVLKCLSE